MSEFPMIVTLCGSTKFVGSFLEVMMKLTLEGKIVIPVGLWGHSDFPAGALEACSDGDESTEMKQMLDQLYYRKIDLANEIFVINVGGYVGASTMREVNYARAMGKKVNWLEPDKACTCRVEFSIFPGGEDELVWMPDCYVCGVDGIRRKQAA